MAEAISRRSFMKASAATAAALALGAKHWGWSSSHSPFGPLQDDPLIRLPVGFSYKVIAETEMPLLGGRGPFPRPPFPDLNVVFEEAGGKILLSTSHEIPAEFPLFHTNPPSEEYDRIASGAVTSLLLNPDLSIAESAYNAGGMITNCSGSGTPWGTVLTGEESTADLEKPHGFIWEVDPHTHTKTRLDACGRFEHETAVVDPSTGYVYLTEDDSTALLYRLRPTENGKLAKGGILEALRSDGTWATISDPSGATSEPHDQGVAAGAVKFRRLEGGAFDGRWFYFTETQDSTGGKVWRLNVDTGVLELYAQGSDDNSMLQPDNLAFDRAGNLFVTEDRSNASITNRNRIVFIDRSTGAISTFAELNQKFYTPGSENIADEPTGPAFSPDGTVLFLNLQKDFFGVTLAITGPFATAPPATPVAAMPRTSAPSETLAVANLGSKLLNGMGLTLGAAAGLVALRRRGEIDELLDPLEDIAKDLSEPPQTTRPKRTE